MSVSEFLSNTTQLLHHRTLSFYSLVYAFWLLCLTEQFSLFGIHVTFCVERSVKCHFPYCYLINYSVLLFIRQLLLIDKKSALVCCTHPEASTIKWGVWPANRARRMSKQEQFGLWLLHIETNHTSFTWNKIAKVHLPGGRAERTINTLKKGHGENSLFLVE